MSSTVKKIEKSVKRTENVKKYELYGSLLGSCIVSIGKLSGKTEKDLLQKFDILKKDAAFAQSKNVIEACDYLIRYFEMDEKYKDNLILVYDEDNVYTPLVTLEIDGQILALDPNNTPLGILAHLDKDSVYFEYIYREEDTENEDNISE